MATLNQIVYNLRDLVSSGRLNDDTTISFRQLKFIVNYKRAQYLRQDYVKNYFDNDSIYQDLGCLEMEEVDEAECCTYSTGCKIYRTKKELPQLIKLVDRLGIKINAINKTTRFEIVLPERFPFITNTKYPSLTEKIFILNNRIYSKNIIALNVRGLLANPEEAKRFICANDTACYTDDSEYPITADMLDLITKNILQTELQALISTVQDLENNAEHNPVIRTN